jgi:hypothetical protein
MSRFHDKVIYTSYTSLIVNGICALRARWYTAYGGKSNKMQDVI